MPEQFSLMVPGALPRIEWRTRQRVAQRARRVWTIPTSRRIRERDAQALEEGVRKILEITLTNNNGSRDRSWITR